MGPLEWFIALVVVGLVLIAVEVFLPGGVLGSLGGLCMLAAAIFGFKAFGAGGGMLALGVMLAATVIFLPVWMAISPRTRFGRRLTLDHNEKGYQSPDPALPALTGQDGVASSSLRPSGVAIIGGKRIDVVAETGYIEPGKPVRVAKVEGMRVIVREVKS